MQEVKLELKDAGSSKKVPLLDPEMLRENNKKALYRDPNMSGTTKLQLERHERLHRKYESGDLRKCILSYFLLCTPWRLKMLAWMGSNLAGSTNVPELDEIKESVPLRLYKIPEDHSLGADKRYHGTDGDLPGCNKVDCPHLLRNSKTHRLSRDQIIEDVGITTTRGGCETVFFSSRLRSHLEGENPILVDSISPLWPRTGSRRAYLYQPLRYPGRFSIVDSDLTHGSIHQIEGQ